MSQIGVMGVFNAFRATSTVSNPHRPADGVVSPLANPDGVAFLAAQRDYDRELELAEAKLDAENKRAEREARRRFDAVTTAEKRKKMAPITESEQEHKYDEEGAAAPSYSPAAAAVAATADDAHVGDVASAFDGDDHRQNKRARKKAGELEGAAAPSTIVHVKAAPVLRPFELPYPHAYLVEKNPHMRALYYFIRKLAGCEPYNPTTRMATYLPQWTEDNMATLWPVNRSSPEYIETERLARKYKDDLNSVAPVVADAATGGVDGLETEEIGIDADEAAREGRRRIERDFKNDFRENMKYFISGAACAAIRNAYAQLRRTPGAHIALISLPTLLTVDVLTDVFVHVVNAHMHMNSSGGPIRRGVSDAAARELKAMHQNRLDRLVNAKRIIQRDGSSLWQFSM